MIQEIKYQAIWGKLYILLGVLFGLLFIFGALILSDFSIFFNLIASIIVIYTGYSMLKRPYARYTENEIIVYTIFGSQRKKYAVNDPNSIRLSRNRLFIGNKKLRLNNWLINKKDWERMLIFFELRDSLFTELKD